MKSNLIRKIGISSCLRIQFFGSLPNNNSFVNGKKHYERRMMDYTIEQMYDVVADVSKYHEFVPWCKESIIIKKNGKNEVDAQLKIGFQYINETYISHVDFDKPVKVIATSSETTLFEYLRTEWVFTRSSNPSKCWVSFQIDFKFKSVLYNNISDLFMTEVVNNMVKAFENRCQYLYKRRINVC